MRPFRNANSQRVRGQRGVSLLAVLGFLAILSALALGIAAIAQRAVIDAQRAKLETQTRAAIDSAYATALQMASGALGGQKIPQQFNLNGLDITFAIRSESEKLDINRASEIDIARVLKSAGLDQDRANQLAAAIADWRDPDSDIRPNGAEALAYADAGRGDGPGNHRFYSVDDLTQVLGVDRTLFDCLRPNLTIYGQQGTSPVSSAPVEISVTAISPAHGLTWRERSTFRLSPTPGKGFILLQTENLGPMRDRAQHACSVLERGGA